MPKIDGDCLMFCAQCGFIGLESDGYGPTETCDYCGHSGPDISLNEKCPKCGNNSFTRTCPKCDSGEDYGLLVDFHPKDRPTQAAIDEALERMKREGQDVGK